MICRDIFKLMSKLKASKPANEQRKRGPWLVGVFFGDEMQPSYTVIQGLFHKP